MQYCFVGTFPPFTAPVLVSLVASSAIGLNHVHAAEIRGVAPSDQAKYAPRVGTDGQLMFQCFQSDQMSESHMVQALPFSSVNDNFCDCPDGSDEPGTSACAGQVSTFYYCSNERSAAMYVYSSRVNDGVCDCCDGSDEWGASERVCPNKCDEEGRILQQERQKREADLRKGSEQRKKLIQAAMTKQNQNSKELERLQEQMPEFEKAEKTANQQLKEAQQALDDEQSLKEENSTSQNKTTSSEAENHTGTTSEEVEARSEPGQDGNADTEGKVVSEYTKWMDGADKALADTGKVVKSAVPLSDDADDEDGEDIDEADQDIEDSTSEEPGFIRRMFQKVLNLPSAVKAAMWGKSKTPLEAALEIAEEGHKAAQKKVRDSRQRIQSLKRKLERENDENSLAYSGLEGRCISKKHSEYKYEVCFFKDAKQDSTSIGSWKRWEAPGIALFDGGQYCPGGPERSLRVVFSCGPTEEITDITEPSRCSYEASMTHPAACTDHVMEMFKSSGPRMPTDEL